MPNWKRRQKNWKNNIFYKHLFMDIILPLYALFWFVIGRWVKNSPSVMAGYYSIPKEQRDEVARRVAALIYRTFRIMAILMVFLYILLRVAGADKNLSGSFVMLSVSVIGSIVVAVRGKRLESHQA